MNDQPVTSTQPVVETASGRVRGAIIEGVAAFKTIPYGAPTSGANRFMPPRKPTPWAGMRDALDYAGHAPQQGLRPATRPELADFSGPPDTSPETEDCLTLNVWSPGARARRRSARSWCGSMAARSPTARRTSPGLQGSRLAQARRRGRRHREPAAEHLRLPGPVRHRRDGIRRIRQCRHARHDRRAGMGARQHRPLRRRSRQRDDLRRVQAAAEKSARCWPCRRRKACSIAPSCKAARRSACANPTAPPS